MKITTKCKAYMAEGCTLGPDDFKNPERIDASDLIFSKHVWADNLPDGWTFVGEAEISVEIPSLDDIISAKVDSLKAKVKSIRADAEAQINFIESQISNLLAIEYSPS